MLSVRNLRALRRASKLTQRKKQGTFVMEDAGAKQKPVKPTDDLQVRDAFGVTTDTIEARLDRHFLPLGAEARHCR